MTELGQMLFGTSATQSHEADWATDGLYMIAEVIAEQRYPSKRQWIPLITSNDGEPTFENDVFVMRSYYWGDCTCEHDNLVTEWENANTHSPDCYQTALHKRHYSDKFPESYDLRDGHDFKDDCMKITCLEFGIDPNAPGGMVHCTCGHRQAWSDFIPTVTHSGECLMDKPNFVYKPTGVEMSWYKHAGRGITCNRSKPSMVRWLAVINDCVSSIKGEEK